MRALEVASCAAPIMEAIRCPMIFRKTGTLYAAAMTMRNVGMPLRVA
jgi:hypothetical protein